MIPPATIDDIYLLCCRYNSPAVNPGAHALAAKIIRMIDAGRIETEDMKTVKELKDANTTQDTTTSMKRHNTDGAQKEGRDEQLRKK
jgi:hypothetical protein